MRKQLNLLRKRYDVPRITVNTTTINFTLLTHICSVIFIIIRQFHENCLIITFLYTLYATNECMYEELLNLVFIIGIELTKFFYRFAELQSSDHRHGGRSTHVRTVHAGKYVLGLNS